MQTQQNYLENVNSSLESAGMTPSDIDSKRSYIERRYRNNYPLSATVEIILRTRSS